MDASTLTYMANQIARNFAAQGDEKAISATVQHLIDFWDPRMKAAILGCDDQALSPIARAAVKRLGGQSVPE